jgi:hypothetical protein
MNSDNKSQQELLLEKIEIMLDKADPEKWKKGGHPLSPNDRFERALSVWHEVFTVETSQGMLVVRRETPTRSDFLGRGFQLSATASPDYIVELRPTGWHHSELTDPNRRSRFPNREKTALVEGALAKQIYGQVQGRYDNHFSSKQKGFNETARNLIERLAPRLASETLDTWQRTEDEGGPGEVKFTNTVDGLTVEVIKSIEAQREAFRAIVSDRTLKAVIDQHGLVKELFIAISELGQTSRLLTLTKMLEDL